MFLCCPVGTACSSDCLHSHSVHTLLAGKGLAARMLHPAAAIWCFSQLFLVLPLNAAILEVMGEGMLDVPLSTASDSLNANGPLQGPF